MPSNNPDVVQVQSRLGVVNGTLYEYLSAHKAQEQHRQREAEVMRELRDMQELQQCTH